jgi:hypothetical protein
VPGSQRPIIEPTLKNPSTMFIVDVCWLVEVTISPISASAAVLRMPIAIPERAISAQKYQNELPVRNSQEEEAKRLRPPMMVRFGISNQLNLIVHVPSQ